MSESVDELFGEGGGAPRPNYPLVFALLGAGLLVSVGGLACTVVPGVVLVMLAWQRIETEMARVENGYLPEDQRRGVLRVRNGIRAVVLSMVILMIAQMVLLQLDLYDPLLLSFLENVEFPLWGPPPEADPAVVPAP